MSHTDTAKNASSDGRRRRAIAEVGDDERAAIRAIRSLLRTRDGFASDEAAEAIRRIKATLNT